MNEPEAGERRATPRVLVVGEGPPTRGGIPTFVGRLLADRWLRPRAHLEYLNTTIEDKRPGAFTASNLRAALAHAGAIFVRGRRVDVVHLNVAATPTLPLARAVLLAAAGRAAGARVILHAHTGQIERSVRGVLYRALLRAAGRLADVVIVVSASAERAAGRVIDNVVLVDNGIDVGAFAGGPKEQRPPVLSFVGTVCERKGLIDLRDALEHLRRTDGALPVQVVVVGDGRQEGPGAFERVKDAYRRTGTEATFTGALDDEGVRGVLARSSIFCLPSHSEGLPLALLEAMASENAIIATAVGDIPRALGGQESGMVVPPRDPSSLARAIETLARSPDDRRDLALAARRRVEEVFSFRRTVERIDALYREASGRRRRDARRVRASPARRPADDA